jgi:serine/threonine protein kinase
MIDALRARITSAWRVLIGAVATEAISFSTARGHLAATRTVIDERFELETLAGRGGMATVWRARDLETGATVAVKLLAGGDDEDLRRFALEADLLESMTHPGVAGYVSRGETDDGAPYLAMEWLEGEDLGQRLRRGRLGVDEAVTLVAAVSETLAVAHRRGVVHRDIKPGNVFCERGAARPRLLDFGVARADGAAATTMAGIPVGTPGYMAPEQIRGERTLDARADVFALGCVLYECLTGVRPFARKDVVGVLLEALHSEPAPLGELASDVPAELEELVHRMLSKRAEERPADAGAVARELRALPRAPRHGCRYLQVLRLRAAELAAADVAA